MQNNSAPIGSLNPNKPITIIGAGISGLLMGYHLKKAGFKVKIIERESRAGGKIQTTQTPFGMQEHAANALFSDDAIYELLADLKIDFIEANSGLKKKVFKNNMITHKLINVFQLMPMLFKLFRKPPVKKDQSVFDFFFPLVGKKFAEEVISGALVGVYAMDAKDLHFHSIFKMNKVHNTYLSFFREIIKKKRSNKKKPSSISFKNGMEDFIFALKNYLEPEITLSENYLEIKEDENSVICTDAKNASSLLANYLPAISLLLKEVEYTSTSTTTVISSHEIKDLNKSFGALIPPKNKDIKTQGILNNSAIFPGRTKSSNLSSYTFISKNFKNDLSVIDQDAKKLELDFSLWKAEYKNTINWEVALPKYNSKRFHIIQELKTELSKTEGIALFGNYLNGISIREINLMAKDFSKELKLVSH